MSLYIGAALTINGLEIPESSTHALSMVAMLVSLGKAMDFESWRAVMAAFDPDYEKKVVVNGADLTGVPSLPPGTLINGEPVSG